MVCERAVMSQLAHPCNTRAKSTGKAARTIVLSPSMGVRNAFSLIMRGEYRGLIVTTPMTLSSSCSSSSSLSLHRQTDT